MYLLFVSAPLKQDSWRILLQLSIVLRPLELFVQYIAESFLRGKYIIVLKMCVIYV